MRLRDVEFSDVGAYIRMRCDPAMMAELGGPLPRESIKPKVWRDVRQATAGTEWIKMIIPSDDAPGMVAGSVVLWSNDEGNDAISEIGWMVLPEYQGRGIGKQAVRVMLDQARDDGRWGPVHAFPAVTNAPSNGICRSLGFILTGEQFLTFNGRLMRANHWIIDPGICPRNESVSTLLVTRGT